MVRRVPFRRSGRPGWLGVPLAAGVLAAALVAAPATNAPAAAGPYVPWSTLLPGWTDTYVPSSSNVCVSGRPECMRTVLRELNWVQEQTGPRCSHHAVFSTAYLRMTQSFDWSRKVPGYYEDVPFAIHQSAVFAKYYTDAFTAYRDGRRASVPEAWRIAFDAARDKRVTGSGDLMLAMNAHINRDLPFVVAAVGLVAPDGSSRKRDYDKVEHFLNASMRPMLAEAAARYDPTVDDVADPLGLTDTALFQIITLWRENTWRSAEALVAAPDQAARDRIAAQIERNAASIARGLLATTGYVWPLTSTRDRDRHCAEHHHAPAPLEYPFGWPKPYGP